MSGLSALSGPSALSGIMGNLWESGEPPIGGDDFEVSAGNEYPTIFSIVPHGEGFEFWASSSQAAQGLNFLIFE